MFPAGRRYGRAVRPGPDAAVPGVPAPPCAHIAADRWTAPPGGWIIAQEPLHHPAPRSFPHLPALDSYWELFHRLVEGFGAPAQAVEQLPVSAAAAGLQVVRMDGSFIVDDP